MRTLRAGWETGDWTGQPAVMLRPYDPRWPAHYEEAQRELAAALAGIQAAVEHVGSTAVPGLAAKATIDIAIGLADSAQLEQCIERLQAAGYDYHFTQPDWTHLSGRGRNLHLLALGGERWRRQLQFRDYLRMHAEAARAYVELKQRLAAESGGDRQRYVDGKTAFVERIVALAELEAAGQQAEGERG